MRFYITVTACLNYIHLYKWQKVKEDTSMKTPYLDPYV